MIKNYTKDNFGVFYCVAENDYGASVSPFVTISEAGQRMQFFICLKQTFLKKFVHNPNKLL